MKYRIIKERLVQLKGGKCAEQVGDVFDADDVDLSSSNPEILLKRGFLEIVEDKPWKTTKERLAAPKRKASR